VGALVLGPSGLSIGPICGAGTVVAGNGTLVLGLAVSSNLLIRPRTRGHCYEFMDIFVTVAKRNVLTSGMYGGQIATPTLGLDNPGTGAGNYRQPGAGTFLTRALISSIAVISPSQTSSIKSRLAIAQAETRSNSR
jgi:hypothetical protein